MGMHRAYGQQTLATPNIVKNYFGLVPQSVKMSYMEKNRRVWTWPNILYVLCYRIY